MTRRDSTVNWGDKAPLESQRYTGLVSVSVDEASPMTVYATAHTRDAAVASATLVMLLVEWGHGGTSIAKEVPVIRRARVPLVGSMVNVSGKLAPIGAAPVPPNASVVVSVMITPGSDGETLRNTRWVAQYGAAGELSIDPQRVMSLEGFNAGAADVWLMIFDGPATLGTFPAMARPVRSGRRFTVRRFDSQGFARSVSWAASSTPHLYTPMPGAALRVDAEFLL